MALLESGKGRHHLNHQGEGNKDQANPSAGDVSTVVPGSYSPTISKGSNVPKKKQEKPKKIKVHSCFDIEIDDAQPLLCACRQDVDKKSAQGMVARGEAVWIPGSSQTAVCLINGLSRRTPRSATIDDKHIDRAYVENDLEERTRINTYGKLNCSVILALVKYVPAEEFDQRKREDWGRCVESFRPDKGKYPATGTDAQLYHRFRVFRGIE
jgi:hypothetical protein